MSDWSAFVHEGHQYLKTARNGHQRKTVFNNELVFNLIGLSIEKLLVGLCLHRGHMPMDHTLSGIVSEADRLCPMGASLTTAVGMMNRVQDLCSLDADSRCTVDDDQIENLLAMNERVAAFVRDKTRWAGPLPVAADPEKSKSGTPFGRPLADDQGAGICL
ncbi:hypothetical protein [Desulfatitalea tepidiphila]|uniref:hypothetical protein n=1 Tax=Desulfatitalea tepidiphila TaxID=1185843 RepID=UPI0006B66274|nr:hypothetical protein [Desulfatitalea tepidiphila]